MKLKYYKILVILLLITIAIFASACDKDTKIEELNLEDLEIIATDALDIEAGTYEVPYTIEDLQEYIEKYGVTVELNVVDETNLPVNITGNTFVIEEGKTYVVDISVLLNGEEIKAKQITIKTIKPTLKSISITTLPTKTSYFVGEIFDPTGMIVTADYGTKTIAINDYTYTLDKLKLSDTSVIITHTGSGKQTTLNIEVLPIVKEIQSVEILNMPTKTTYIEGENFDPAGMSLIAKYNDQTIEILDSNSYSYRTEILTLFDTRLTITHTESGKSAIIEIQIIPYDSKFTITFNGNGGNLVEGEESQEVYLGFDAIAPTYTKKGYLFNGFDGSYQNVSSSLTLNAQWLDTSIGSASLSYSINSDYSAYYIDSYWGNDETIIIPSVYNNLPVENIGSEAFLNNTNIKRIFISSSIENIGNNAFKGCSNLLEFVVDSYNQHYYAYQKALYYDNALISVPKATTGSFILKEGITDIATKAFEDCTNLTNITITDSVLNVGQYAFRNSGWYNALNDGVVYINRILVGYKGNMPANYSLNINLGAYAIASYAFSNQNNIISVSFTDELLVIGNGSFYDCGNISEINLPANLDKIGANAFSYCENLITLNINNKLNTLGALAFQNCSSLTNINFNNNDKLLKIEENTFQNCTHLAEIYFGESSNIQEISQYAFQNCYLLDFSLPLNINTIKNNAFENCRTLSTLNLQASLKTIGNYAFAGCCSLIIVNCERNTAPSIGEDIFVNASNELAIWVDRNYLSNYKENWSSYQNIIYPYTVLVNFESLGGDEVTSIETTYNTTITKPQNPNHPEKYFEDWYTSENYAYIYDFSTLLTADTTLYAKWRDYTPSLVFQKNNEDMTCTVIGIGADEINVFIPSKFQDYTVIKIESSVFQNNELLTEVRLPLTLKEIGSSAFSGCTNLELINLPSSLESIGMNAFSNCENLDLMIPNNVTYIGYHAFDNTLWFNNQTDGIIYAGKIVYGYKGEMPLNYSISSFNIGSIGFAAGAFKNQNNLVSITIPSNFISIAENVFENSGLTSITIPNSIIYIKSTAFYSCSSLTEIYFEENSQIQEIGNQAFYNTSISSAIIPESIKSIENNAFGSCTSLKSVTILASEIPELGAQVFCYYLSNFFSDLQIIVPYESVENYKNADNWNVYTENIISID